MASSADTQSDKARRDAILDELSVAMESWFEKESSRITAESDFIKSVLRGRTGSDRLRAANTVAARVLVINDIDSFLSGEGA